jgi:short-subunit dehydrogenase
MKRAMITGASSTLGRAFAKTLAARGFALTLVAPHGDKLDAQLVGLPGSGHSARPADLTSTDGIDAVAEHLRAVHHQVLINNAGVGVLGGFAATPLSTNQRMMKLNIDAVVALSHAFLEVAVEGDALLNTASTLGLLSMPGATTYAATKAFVVSFSEGLWHEQRPRGVYVASLCPPAQEQEFDGGGERPAPGVLQSPDEIVEAAMAALEDRKSPTVVVGLRNRLMVSSARRLPRRAMVQVMGAFKRRDDD